MKKTVIGILIAVLALTAAAWLAPQEQEKKPPSVVRIEILNEYNDYTSGLSDEERLKLSNDDLNKKLAEIARQRLPSVQTEDLSREETFFYGKILNYAELRSQAQKVLSQLAEGKDIHARNAAKELLSAAISDEKVNTDSIREMLKKYRSRFSPSMEDGIGLYNVLFAFTHRLDAEGRNAEAVEIIKEELAYLTFDKPHYSWIVLGLLAKYDPDKEKVTAILQKYLDIFTEKANGRAAESTTADSGTEAREKEKEDWKYLVEEIQAAKNRFEILNGRPAPDLAFTHVLNSGPITFSELRGKVVVLDFWANWCGPCIASFPQMREMQARYKESDVVIIGVTGFQGGMMNHGGEPVEDISEEEELELTKQFIKHQNVTWPIAFSTRGVSDLEYGITAIPQVVIIDKKGYVRMILHPSKHDEIVALIEKLRAE